MRWPLKSGIIGILMTFPALFCVAVGAPAQEVKKELVPAPQKAAGAPALDESVQAIENDYQQEMLRLDRRRLERLARLAASQNPADAGATYEHLFRLAIGGDLFRDAEEPAKTLLKSGNPSRTATALAHLTKIIAEADRGAYGESLESLGQAIAERNKAAQTGSPRTVLPTGEILAICDAYYQRLIHAGQYETARKALRTILEQTERPIAKEFLSNRLKRLELVGKPAPPIVGTDVDGKKFDLGGAKGKVVLVVFWASWCVPNVAEIDSLEQVEAFYRGKGLQVVGIDLDALANGGQKIENALPNVRRFLLDYNVTWPTLINGQGQNDYARAYGVTEIPANVLIARDGTVAQIDLVQRNLVPAIARAVGE